jgi:gliding motility-associated-like protein
MNRYTNIPLKLFSLILLIGCAFTATAELTFSGNSLPVIPIDADASTGLAEIYVLNRANGVKAIYTSPTASQVKWMRFSSLGGGYAEDIESEQSGNVSTITLGDDDMGYIIDDGATRTCYWIVNYANHVCNLQGLSISPEQDCLSATLLFTGDADRIIYYTVNGVAHTLSRELLLENYTLEYNTESNSYEQVATSTQLEYISSEIHATAPLCNTEFYLSGDRFQMAWGGGTTIQSPTFQAMAVEAVTSATQTERSVDNEQKSSSDGNALGGSAPVEIKFEAIATDAAVYHEWQFANDSEFTDIELRVNGFEYTRVFTEYGTLYVRFVAGDDSGLCTWTSETYTVNVGESKLECPNAFSPGASEGTNDEWKVSYKSIISFDCHIYNRWGLEVAHLTDPSQGWDGKYNGKLVKSGVFFYVIKAEGADGKKYKLSGDINIIHAKYNSTTSSASEE